ELRHVDLGQRCVLLGKPELAAARQLHVGGVDLGPKGFWVMASILLLNAAFIAVFYKELKLATFDAALATALGFAPGVLHYGLMTLVSVTAVGAVESVGALLVVGPMIGPPAAPLPLAPPPPPLLLLSA